MRRLQTVEYGSEAEAIDDEGSNIAGDVYTSDGEYTAVLWNTFGNLRGTIKGLLANPYKISIGQWNPAVALCISGDGYTVGGYGTNPDGKYEGYVAVLPPILHPPILVNPGPRLANVAAPLRHMVEKCSDMGLPQAPKWLGRSRSSDAKCSLISWKDEMVPLSNACLVEETTSLIGSENFSSR